MTTNGWFDVHCMRSTGRGLDALICLTSSLACIFTLVAHLGSCSLRARSLRLLVQTELDTMRLDILFVHLDDVSPALQWGSCMGGRGQHKRDDSRV